MRDVPDLIATADQAAGAAAVTACGGFELFTLGDGGRADIVELILAGQQRILLMQQALYDAGRCGGDSGSARALVTVWARLADVIDMHADAEEEICYLAMFGTRPQALAQIKEAVAELDEIGEAVAEARLQPCGTTAWWRAVKAALSACAGHFERQEQTVLADFRRSASRSLRQQLGSQWATFITARISDLVPDAQVDGAACALCRWPMPASHRHVLDNRGCAVLCACHCCYQLHQWAARKERSGAQSSQALHRYSPAGPPS